ncbi:MAG: glycosyltransferase family 39 protein [Pseudomonadota bacterium]
MNYNQNKISLTSNKVYLALLVLFTSLIYILLKKVEHEDVYETLYFSKEFTLNYLKHPPVTFWITHLIVDNIPSAYFVLTTYIFVVVIKLIVVFLSWQLSKEILANQNLQNLVAISMTIALFSRFDIKFTPDIFQLLFGALFISASYYVLKYGHWQYWCLLTLFALLAVLTKYHMAIMILASGIPFIATSQGRQRIFSKNFVLSALAFITIASFYIYNANNAGTSTSWHPVSDKSLQSPKAFFGAIFFGGLFPIGLIILYFQKDLLKKSLSYFNQDKLNTYFLLSNSLGFLILFLTFRIITQYNISQRYTLSNIVITALTIIYIFQHFFAKIDFSAHKFKRIVQIFCAVVLLVFGLRIYFSDYPGEYKIYNLAASQIQQATNVRIDFLIQSNRSFDKVYASFQDKPYVIGYENIKEEDLIAKIKNHNFVLLWAPSEQLPQWVVDLQKQFPDLQISQPIILASEPKTYIGKLFKKHQLAIQYAYLK